MKIEVIGPGCPFRKTLSKRVNEVVSENGIVAEIEHVTDLKICLKYIPRTPVLAVDGQVRHRGKWLPDKKRLKALLIGV
ncbi:MAG TPA: thioredoxin family protein [Deltaproteobacteria bacterium]|nr:thioredoxin family protein [Deltaproteobacteria bacterium]